MVVYDREPIGLALRRFKRLLKRHGITREMRRRCSFTKATLARRIKQFGKRLIARKQTLLEQMTSKQPVVSLQDAKKTFSERTGKP